MINLFSPIKDYLVDQEDEIRQLIMWFLNLVMEEEASSKLVHSVMSGLVHVKPVETAQTPNSPDQAGETRIVKAPIP